MATKKTVRDNSDLVRNHPETAEIEIGGRRFLFLLSGYGAKLAREKGKDPIPVIFSTLSRLAPAAAKHGMFAQDGEATTETFTLDKILAILSDSVTGEFFDDLCTIVYWGVLTAQPDTDIEEIQILVTPAGLRSIVTAVWPRMLSYAKDLKESDIKSANEGEGEGK